MDLSCHGERKGATLKNTPTLLLSSQKTSGNKLCDGFRQARKMCVLLMLSLMLMLMTKVTGLRIKHKHIKTRESKRGALSADFPRDSQLIARLHLMPPSDWPIRTIDPFLLFIFPQSEPGELGKFMAPRPNVDDGTWILKKRRNQRTTHGKKLLPEHTAPLLPSLSRQKNVHKYLEDIVQNQTQNRTEYTTLQ